MTIEQLKQLVAAMPHRSAWLKGVNEYALEMLERLESEGYEVSTRKELEKTLLNGAASWSHASWGGSFLCYNSDIAERLCTPSELKRTDGGRLKPNAREQWLDTQARALYQAASRILWAYDSIASIA